jgi:molybdopterin synthase sulfur carrier subunit
MPIVKLYANLRKLAGTKELSIAGATVGEVMNELVKLHPALNGIVLENGELRPHVIITLNGRNTSDMKMQITEQDVMAIFPPIAGG